MLRLPDQLLQLLSVLIGHSDLVVGNRLHVRNPWAEVVLSKPESWHGPGLWRQGRWGLGLDDVSQCPGQGGKLEGDTAGVSGDDCVRVVDLFQLSPQQVVLLGQLHNSGFQHHVVDAAFFAGPLGGLVVSPATVPIGVILFLVGDKLPLFPLPEQLLVVGRY